MTISATPDGNYTYSGIGKEIHEWLEKKLKFTYYRKYKKSSFVPFFISPSPLNNLIGPLLL